MTAVQEERNSDTWIPDDSTFGARLALIRQRMGWGNVKEAAMACGQPPESWRTWERDGVTPRKIVEVARAVSHRTGVDFWWLITGERRRPTAEYPVTVPAQRRATVLHEPVAA